MSKLLYYFFARYSGVNRWHLELYRLKRYICLKYFYTYTLKHDFLRFLSYPLNLNNPITFNEKLQWLKCYYRDQEMARCADKLAVREIVHKTIGNEYLVPIYGVYENACEIDFNKLPDKFVLKSNHASGQVVICNDKRKMDWTAELKKMSQWLKVNYYYVNGEWVYKDIKPKIICEKLLGGEIVDYKFMCFHGEPKVIFTCSERETQLKVTFFDGKFNKLPFIRKYPSSNKIKRPCHLDMMLDLSKKLAKDFPFVRVDFYENEGNVYFGELTFFPGNGMEWFDPIEWDYKLGEFIDFSKVRKEYICKK